VARLHAEEVEDVRVLRDLLRELGYPARQDAIEVPRRPAESQVSGGLDVVLEIAPAAVGLLGAIVLAGYAAVVDPVWIFATAIIAGAIRGSLTLVQASAIADGWGSQSYGQLNGILAGPVSALTVLTPSPAATWAVALGSYWAMGLLMATICAVGGILVIRL
jgi:hypothetical protein